MTELTVEVVSPHMTATTFKLPAACAAVMATATEEPDDAVADLTCTKLIWATATPDSKRRIEAENTLPSNNANPLYMTALRLRVFKISA